MPLSKTTRSKIKQTRLELTPLGSSSPAEDKYSTAIQSRLANVRYGSRTRRQTQLPLNFDPKPQEQTLPTPEPSSQPHHESTALAETSHDVTSPYQDPDASELSDVPSSPTPRPTVVEDDDEDDDVAPPSSKRKRTRRPGPTSQTEIQGSPRKLGRRSTRLTQASSPTQVSPLSHSRRRLEVDDLASPVRRLSDLASAEATDDDDEVMVTKPTAKRHQAKQHDHTVVVHDDRVQYVTSEEKLLHRVSRSARKTKQRDWHVGDDEVEYITSDDEPITPSRSRKRSTTQMSAQRKRREQQELADDLADLQDSDEVLTRSRKSKPINRSRGQQQELEDDLQDSDTPKMGRTRGGVVNTQRDKRREHLEALKRRRAGEKAPRVSSSNHDNSASEPEGVDIDTINQATTAYSISDDEIASAHSAVDTDAEQQEPAADNEDGFIVEDEEDDRPAHRRLPHPDIPLQFTSYASAKPKDLFIHVIEWLIKNKIAPAFARNDPIYRLAFDKINDQVAAQAGSRLISAAWSSTFKHAVLARPNMNVVALPGLDEDNIRTCDACNKTNHPARYDFVFSGKAYSKDDLEPLDDSDHEDDEDDENNGGNDDNVSRDGKGHPLASQSTHFYLGRYCAANAEMGHKLTHWLYHLNLDLLAYLEEQGVLSADAIVAREKLNKKKREKEAENIVDLMAEQSKVMEMWKDFQNDLDDARLGMEGFEKKGGRSRHRVGSIFVQRGQLVEEDSE